MKKDFLNEQDMEKVSGGAGQPVKKPATKPTNPTPGKVIDNKPVAKPVVPQVDVTREVSNPTPAVAAEPAEPAKKHFWSGWFSRSKKD